MVIPLGALHLANLKQTLHFLHQDSHLSSLLAPEPWLSNELPSQVAALPMLTLRSAAAAGTDSPSSYMKLSIQMRLWETITSLVPHIVNGLSGARGSRLDLCGCD